MTTKPHPITADVTVDIDITGDNAGDLGKIKGVVTKAVKAQFPGAVIKVSIRFDAPGLRPVHFGPKRREAVDGLVREGAHDLPTLCALTPGEVWSADGVGPAGMMAIRKSLYDLKLSLKDDAPFPSLIDSLRIGPKIYRQLSDLGIYTVDELAARREDPLVRAVFNVGWALERHREDYPEHYKSKGEK